MRKQFTKKGKIIMSAVMGALMLLFIILQIIIPGALLYPFAILCAVFAPFPWLCGYIDKAIAKYEKEKPKGKPSKPTSYRRNPYTDEKELDDGLSFEEIDFFESDIYDE